MAGIVQSAAAEGVRRRCNNCRKHHRWITNHAKTNNCGHRRPKPREISSAETLALSPREFIHAPKRLRRPPPQICPMRRNRNRRSARQPTRVRCADFPLPARPAPWHVHPPSARARLCLPSSNSTVHSHAKTRHPIHRSVGRSADRHHAPKSQILRLRRCGTRLLGRPL